mgnify:FL=1
MRTSQALSADPTMWLAAFCPYCKTKNWFCLGDLSDCTAPTIEAGQCFQCNKKFWLSAEMREESLMNHEEDDSSDDELINEAFCEKGQKLEKI